MTWLERLKRFPRRWLPETEPNTTRIDDPFYRELVAMYSNRARYWRWISLFLLVGTSVIIAAGAWIFYVGDVRTDIKSSAEIDIVNQLRTLSGRVDAFRQQEAKIVDNRTLTDRAQMLAEGLNNMVTTVKNLQNQTKWKDVRVAYSKVDFTRSVVKQLGAEVAAPQEVSTSNQKPGLSEPAAVVTFDVPTAVPRLQSFSKPVILRLARICQKQAVDLEELLKRLVEFQQTLENLQSAKPADSQDDIEPGLFQDTNTWIETNTHLLTAIQNVKSQVDIEKIAADLAEHEWKENAAGRATEIAELETRREQYRIDLDEARTVRNRILFMTWVPNLTLRVGIVILMLFFTQILLATYRYTVALSGFYLARADAIRLLQPGDGRAARWYSIDHFRTLMENLTPGSISVEHVTAPSEQLADLAKSWVTKRP